MAGFGRDFGQKVDLIARIRQALQDYPAGVSMFKEFIQNADDAGARQVQICLDLRSHSAAKTAWKQNAEDMQGPALLVFNDAVFDDGDFVNITHLGNSDKVTQVNKIGRFGVGINVMYHLSDVPSFVSRDRFVFFDPHATFLPGVNPAMPGKSIFFLGEDQEVVTEYADMFTPFNAFGFDIHQLFNGALFRLPLRTQLLAESSRLSNQSYSPDAAHTLLQSFVREMSSCLIFLKSVESISVSIWQRDASAPSPLYSSSLSTVPRDSFTRARLDAAAAGNRDLFTNSTRIDSLAIITECASTHSQICEMFIVSSQVGSSAEARPLHNAVLKAAGSLGNDSINSSLLSKKHPKLRLVPLAAVAVRTAVIISPPTNISEAENVSDRSQKLFEDIVEYGKIGRLFCFLPLPITSGLPVHVNSTFEVSSSRQDIWKLDESSGGDGAVRGLWNVLVVQDAVIACYVALLENLASSGHANDEVDITTTVYNLFPPSNNVVLPFWRDALACIFYETVGHAKVLRDAGTGTWFRPGDVTSLFSLPPNSVVLEKVLSDVLRRHSTPFIGDSVIIPREQLQLLHDHAGLKRMSPLHLIDIFSHLHLSNRLTITHNDAVQIFPFLISASLSPSQARSLITSLFPLPIIPSITGHVLCLSTCRIHDDRALHTPLRIMTTAEQQGVCDLLSSVSTINVLDPSAVTPEVLQFFALESVRSACDVGQLIPSDVPVMLNSICDLNSNLNADSIKLVWTHLLLRSDEWFAAAAGFRIVPAFGKYLRPEVAARCCYFVSDEVHIPAAVMTALESNGIASVHFSSLILNSKASYPLWLGKAFLGHKGSELAVALRDVYAPGYLQDASECDTLRYFFFSELRQYEDEWDEPARLALKQLPIHRIGTLHQSKSLSGCAAIDDAIFVVGPTCGNTPIDPAWLTSSFIVIACSDDEIGYDKLRIPKINSAYWYTHHFFPFIDEFDAAVIIAALQRLLDSFHTLSAEPFFITFIKSKGRFVTATGTIVFVGELVIPADASCALLMDTSVAPAHDLAGEIRSKVLVELGARSRPNLDDIKRAISSVTAATKSGWNDEVTAHSQHCLDMSIAFIEILSRFAAEAKGELSDLLLDTAGRAVAAAAQVVSCPSLGVSFATLPWCFRIPTSMQRLFRHVCPLHLLFSILRLLAVSRHFVSSYAALQENFLFRGKSLIDVLASSTSDLVDRVSFFDSFCRDNIGTHFVEKDASFHSALSSMPGPNSKPDVAELIQRFEAVIFPAIYYLPVDDPILIGLLKIGLRHIDNIVATHGLNASLSVQRKFPELVAKVSFWSCICGAPQSAHDFHPWGSPEAEKAIASVSAENWLPVLASLQFVADALIEVAETCAVAGVASDGHAVESFASVKLSQKSRRMSHRLSPFSGPGEGPAQSARLRAGSRSPPRQSFSAIGRYDGVRCYDLSTLDSFFEKQGVSVCEKLLLESARHSLQNVHTLTRVLMSKVLCFDLNSVLYGQLFIQHINLLEQVKSFVLHSLDSMKKTLKGDSGSSSNLIVSLCSAAHAVTLTLVDDAILNGGASRNFSRSLAITLEGQLQNVQQLFVEWLQENVTDFVPALFPMLFKSKHMEFLLTEIIPLMKRDSTEIVSLFEASYAKAQNHVPASSPYFLSRIILARDSGDASAATFRTVQCCAAALSKFILLKILQAVVAGE